MFFNQNKLQFNSTNLNPISNLVFQILISKKQKKNTISISKYQTGIGCTYKTNAKCQSIQSYKIQNGWVISVKGPS